MATDTISNQINRITNNIENAYSALYGKGATMPATNNSALLADTINTISTGGGGSDEVGRYMIDNGIAKKQAGDITGRFTSITGIDNSAMNYAFNGLTSMTGSPNFHNCTYINNYGMQSAFQYCYNITGEANFCNLTNAGNYAMFACFENCSNIEGVNLSSLTSVSGNNTFAYAFRYCNNMSGTIDLSNLITISGANSMNGMFQSCPKITGVNLCNLTDISGAPMMFYGSGNSNNPMTLNFSSLVNAGMYRTFAYAQVIDFNCPSVVNVSMSNTFEYAKINSVNLHTLVDVGEMRFCFQNSTLTSVFMDNVVNAGTSNSNSSTSMGLCNTFANCNYLTDVHLNSLTRIRGTSMTGMAPLSGTFQQCTNLTRLFLPSLTEVGYSNGAYLMCWNCQNLTTITIGGGDEAIEEAGTLTINGWYGNYAGMRCFQSAFAQTGISQAYFQFEGSDSKIGNQAFFRACSNCSNLSYGSISVRETNSQAFQRTFSACSGLGNIDLHIDSSVSEANIASDTFTDMVNGCSSLTYSTIEFVGLNIVLQDNAFANAFANSGLSDMQIEVYGTASSTGAPFTRMVSGCNNVDLRFYSFDATTSGDIFANTLAGSDGSTITFSLADQAVVETFASYNANFGGTNVTVVFE